MGKVVRPAHVLMEAPNAEPPGRLVRD